MSVIVLLSFYLICLLLIPQTNVVKVCDMRAINCIIFLILDIYMLNGYYMNANARQTMQDRSYSLKDFRDYIDYEIDRQYGAQTSASQRQADMPQQNQIRQQRQQQ